MDVKDVVEDEKGFAGRVLEQKEKMEKQKVLIVGDNAIPEIKSDIAVITDDGVMERKEIEEKAKEIEVPNKFESRKHKPTFTKKYVSKDKKKTKKKISVASRNKNRKLKKGK